MNLKSTFQKYTQLTSELKDVTSELSQALQNRFEDYQAEVSALRQELFYPPNMPTIEREGGSGMWYSGAGQTSFRVMSFKEGEFLVVESTAAAWDEYGDTHGTAFVPVWLLEDCWDETLEAKVVETREVFDGRTQAVADAEYARFQEYLALAKEFENRR